MEFLTLYILMIVFLATVVRATLGFGESLIAVPLLVFFIPIETVVPYCVLLSTFIAAVVVVQDRKEVHFKSAKWMVLFATFGIPIGLLLLIYGNEKGVKGLLGVLIILYSVYSLRSKNVFRLKSDNKAWLFVCGFLSGVLGGAYGLNSPPLIVYGNLRSWTAQRFRATLQAYFLPAGIVGMAGYWYKGLWDSTVTYYFLISIPVMIPAIFIGKHLSGQLTDGAFIKYVYIGLICIGTLLLIQTLV